MNVSLFNPGFESGIHTDARSICTAGNMNAITVETSAAHTGTYGMKWNPALASGYGTLTIKPKTVGQSTTYIPSARGTYTFSFWAKTNAMQGAHTVTLRFQFYDANNTLLDEVAENAAQSVPITTQWQQFTIDVDQPVNGTTYVQPIVDIALTEDLNNASFYFDDLSLDFVSIPLPVLPKRTNLIKNPSFQSSTFGWTVREATIARDTTQHYLGDACLRMNAISGGTQSSLTMNRAIPVVAGADYTLSAYIKIPSNLSIPYRVMIEWYSGPNNDGTYLGETISAMFQNTTDWTRRFVTGRAPAGAQSAIAYVIGTALTTASTDVLYIDAVLMETGDLQEYFDGDTPGYTWDGVPYESTSSTKAVFPVVPQGPDYLRLEVEHPTEGLQNLINNPSGAKGAWGWQTPKETTNLLAVDDGSGGPALKFTTTIQQTANLKTEFIACAPGTYMAAQMTILDRTGITSNVRARFDFYDVNKAYVSSSSFTAYFEQLGTFYTPPALVPAGAAYVQWRVDMGNSAFTDTQARAGQYFTYNKAMLTSTLTTGALGTLRRNLVPNPSFTSALTGWEGAYGSLTRVTTGGFTGAANARYQQVPNGASHLYRVSNYNKPIAITGGRDYTFSAYIKVTAAMTVRYKLMIEWYDDNMNWLGSKEEADPNKMWYAVQPWTRYSLTATAPSKATKAVLYFVANTDGSKSTLNAFYIDGVLFEEGNVLKGYFDGETTDTATINYGWTGTANNSISTSTTTGDAWDYEDPNDWRNILGPTHEISINRNALDVGTLSAEILDADLDPAVATWVTPGKRVRMLSLVGDDWESLFEGRLTNANVTYDKPKGGIAYPERLVATNLVPNPNLVDTTGSGTADLWNPNKVNFTVATNDDGMTLTAIDNGGAAGGPEVNITMPGPVAGDTITAGITFDGNNTALWRVHLLCYNGGTYIGSAATSANLPADGTERVVTGTLLANTTTVRLAVYQASTIQAGQTVRITSARAVYGTGFKYPYFDGDSIDPYYVYHWTGTPYGSASTKNKPAVTPKTDVRIQVTASDSISHLANQGEARGVNTIDELPYILEGRGVPWNVNGSGNQVPTATVVSLNDNASVLDQVAICRDSNLGYAWVDREDVLQAWDASKMATGNVYTFSDQASNDATWLSYSDIDVNFNTEVCINDVTITYLRYDVQAGQTEEVIYGPYRNEDSVRTWGAMSANFTIQSQVESPSAIAAYAQSVLAANGVPVIRANGLSTPVRNDKERKAVTLLDLYSPVAVKYDNKVDNTYRITGITHTITPKLWTVDYTFDVQDSVAAPQVTPSPSKSGVGDVTPFNAINVKSGRDANTSAGNTPALMVGPRTGTHLRVDGNEILAMTNDNTQGSLYLNQGGTTAIGTAQVTQLNARGNIQSGTVTSAALANGATVSIPVTFSTPFNSVPSVVGSTSSYRYTVGATSITKTGFNLMVANYSGAAGAGINATWIAVGM